jgi:diguanylate cyclase (GGDEF)-like protein/PAS domain S-box-containing protein
MQVPMLRLLTLLFTLALLGSSTLQAFASKPIKLQLQWKYQFQFAGFIMAKELGYYDKAGLDVDILEYQNTNSIKELEEGKIDYAINNSILNYDDGRLNDVTLLATYFQRSPLIIIAQPEIKSVLDLKGKRVMMSENNRYNSSLSTLMDYFNLSGENVNYVDPSFNLDDFIEKRVDAITAFRSNELYELDRRNVPYAIIDPVEYGFSTNAINLFTSQEKIINAPEEIVAFLDATKKGWEYALGHIRETATLIHRKYQSSKSVAHLIYEGEQTRMLMLPELFEIGEINTAFLEKRYDQLVKQGILDANQSTENLTFDRNNLGRYFIFTEEERAWITQHPLIHFTGDPDWLPYEAFDREGNYIGIVAEYLGLIEKHSGLAFKTRQPSSWSEALDFAVSKQVQVISGDVADKILNKTFDPVTPYRENPIVIIMEKQHHFVDDLHTLADKRIAIVKDYGYTADIYDTYPGIPFIEVETIHEGLNGVANGEYDAMLATMSLASYTMMHEEISNLRIVGKTPIIMRLTLFVDSDEPMLHRVINKALRHISDQEILEINRKWFVQPYVERIDYSLTLAITLVSLLALAVVIYWNRRLKSLTKALINTSTRYQTLTESTQDGFWMLDAAGNILEVNQTYCELSGYSEAELVTMHISDVEIIESPEKTKQHVQHIIEHGSDLFTTRHRKKNGEIFPVQVSVSYKAIEGGRFFALVRDITDQVTEDELYRLRQELSRLVFESSKETLLQTALDAAEAMTQSEIGFFHFIEDDENAVSLQVWSTNTLQNMCFAEGNSMHYPISQAGVWVDCVHERAPVIYNDYESLPHKKGLPEGHAPLTRFISVPIMRNNRIKAIVGVGNKHIDYSEKESALVEKIGSMAFELHEQQQAQQQIELLAYHDPLTQLPNRTLLTDRMHQALAMTRRNDKLLAVCYLDLDGFKPINDRYGHELGDALLKQLAQRLKHQLREGDTVARLGGDEFVVVLTGLTSLPECEEIVQRTLDTVIIPFEINDHLLRVSASIGVTIFPNDESDTDSLLRHADQAMYQAKTEGNSSYHFYDPIQNIHTNQRKEMLEAFSQAIEHDELLFHYQPKIDLNSAAIIGFEALIRWQHPERGLLFPGDFLPLIENTPQEFLLGEWVLKEGLETLSRWSASGIDSSLSVNISPRQVQQTDYGAILLDTLKAYPSAITGKLELEILEVAEISKINDVIAMMDQCAELGVRFSLDDFGTGYASLSHFHRLPVDILKVDQNFVKEILNNPNDLDIVDGVLQLAQKLQRPTVAEGVETLEIGMMLRGMGCQYAQGYGIARPMPGDRVETWIAQWNEESEWHEMVQWKHSINDEPALNVALYAHDQWLKAIRHAVASGNPFPPLDENECQFGHWYKGIGLVRFGSHGSYAFIQPKHHEVHQRAKRLHEILDNGDRSAIEQSLAELQEASNDLLEYMKQLKA